MCHPDTRKMARELWLQECVASENPQKVHMPVPVCDILYGDMGDLTSTFVVI